MAGIDNIIKQIEADSDSQCEVILSQAEASAGRIVSQARDEARLAEDDNRKALEKTRSRLERSARSSADLVRRQAVLNAEYDIVGSVLTKAYASILDMDKDDYLEFIPRLSTSVFWVRTAYAVSAGGILTDSRSRTKRIFCQGPRPEEANSCNR